MAPRIVESECGGVTAGDGAEQPLHGSAPAETLQVANQSQAAVRLSPPAELNLAATTHLQQNGLLFAGETGERPPPLRRVAQPFQTGRKHVGVAENRWQDGEMGHERMPAFPDPSDPDCSVQWPLPQQASMLPPGDQRARRARIAVMASGSGSNFEALVEACRRGVTAAEPALLVVNTPGCGAIARAERLGVAWRLVDHRAQPSREALDRELIGMFQAQAIDLVVMAGWMRIVTPVLIAAFPDRLVNIHPSLLPSFRGRDGVAQALAAGVTLAGCTAHLVSEEVDAGRVLVQAAVPVLQDDSLASLTRRIQRQEHRILPLAVQLALERLRVQG